jgi:hypothetical protein
VFDCAGVINGSSVKDNCDTCDADSSNDCVADCAGIWGGTAFNENFYTDIDNDGFGAGDAALLCNGFTLTGWVTNNTDSDDYCNSNNHDCNGICDGSLFGTGVDGLGNDDCGICGGSGIPSGYCDCAGNVADCAGECGGSLVLDNCNTCDNDPNNNCVQDCNGDWGGTAVFDGCFICGGDSASCTDCAGVLNGVAVLDNCSICAGGTTGLDACVADCAGVWGGSAAFENYYLDSDSDGLGSGSSSVVCSASAPSGWGRSTTN